MTTETKLYAVKCADRTTGETKWCVVQAASKHDALREAESLGHFTSDVVVDVPHKVAETIAPQAMPQDNSRTNPVYVKLHPSSPVEILARVALGLVALIAAWLILYGIATGLAGWERYTGG